MGKKKEEKAFVGGSVETTAIITLLEIGVHEDDISFTALDFSVEGDKVMRGIIKEAAPVAMIISLSATEADPNFPPIRVEGFLSRLQINKTCDKPIIKKIQFSSGQAAQIHGYIRNEEEIKLKFVQIQESLPFEEDEEKAPKEPKS